MLEEAVKKMLDGISVDSFKIYAKKISKGRSEREVNLEIYLQKDKEEGSLLYIKAFNGLRPHYKPWVELFNINNHLTLKGEVVEYFDSILEDNLLNFFSGIIVPGGKIYVEYYQDKETLYGLSRGFPPVVSRLGYKLFALGFTWFKDWYFPEGWMEGGAKLQGEKPLDGEAKNRHIRNIHDEIPLFLGKDQADNKTYVTRAVKRAREILIKLEVQKMVW